VVDRFSKLAHYKTFSRTDNASHIATLLLREFVRLHGIPTNIASDQDMKFMNYHWTTLMTMFDINIADLSPSRPPGPPSGPMTRARAKALHQEVNSLLSVCDLNTPLNGMLPHANTICVIRYLEQEAHHESRVRGEEDEEFTSASMPESLALHTRISGLTKFVASASGQNMPRDWTRISALATPTPSASPAETRSEPARRLARNLRPINPKSPISYHSLMDRNLRTK
jgi:hypothetical protein